MNNLVLVIIDILWVIPILCTGIALIHTLKDVEDEKFSKNA